jgi:hypothetical protein
MKYKNFDVELYEYEEKGNDKPGRSNRVVCFQLSKLSIKGVQT